MYEVTFRVEGDDAYSAPTRETGATIELWCNDHCDLLHVSDGDGGAADAVRSHVADLVGIRDEVRNDSELILVTADCLRKHEYDNIKQDVVAHDCLLLQPIRYKRGEKFCRVLSLTAENLADLYETLREQSTVSVESKREIETVSQDRPLMTLETVLTPLSTRQREAVVIACERGYYSIPRETTTQALAEELGVDRRTYEEFLRRAEQKLVESMVEYMYH
ncbi:helix-turn-helix domain-containing protein [Halosolutus amylolyticus]|uniref:Helix-turn-helix domain-containing protein n=1 Tax=Halosolutus amylolyticus TaxID=2932267 RepID=A0ABD5PKF2_9EURY|nr:helix-turn-helix domain-containing protein [Halosolutus amylolyticus]